MIGTADDPEQLGWLLAYSPYHRVRPGTAYPAVLLTGATVDERTGDAHVRKMCAALQHATTSGKPILMRRTADNGHTAGTTVQAHQAATDMLTFLAHHTGLAPPPDQPPGASTVLVRKSATSFS